MRLNKFLADSGAASRRKADELILQGRVDVNNKTIVELGYIVDPEKDVVKLDGEKLHLKTLIYFLMNKPKGVITSTDDEKDRTTVVDLIKTKEKIFPVGRLDYNTTGVLILTNDGDFSYLLTHPKNNVERIYEVKINRPLEQDDKDKLLKGVYLKDGKGKFEKIVFPKEKDRTNIEVHCVEGRNHFIKNMFGCLSYNVITLNRKKFAGFTNDIPVGTYRKLELEEIERIKKKYAKNK